MDLQDEHTRRLECLKLAASQESNPDQIVIDADKFLLFLEGKPQVGEDADTDRG